MDAPLLQKYLQATCSPAEIRAVRAYLRTEEGQRQLQQLLDTDLDGLAELPLSPHEQVEAGMLFQRIQARKGPVWKDPVRKDPTWEEPARSLVRPLGLRPAWLVAATVSLVFIATGVGWFYQQYVADQRITVRTGFGQTRRMHLPDQSIVALNGNTSITYPKRWSSDAPREVWVNGEAFFEVVHTPNHQRFTVHLPANLNIEVLGTRFNVYTRKAKTQVVLSDGRIRLKGANSTQGQFLMRPGDLFYADTQAHVSYKKRVNANAFASWRTDKLTFEGATLAEIAQQLEEIYGIPINIPDKALRNQRVSGTIPSKNMSTVLTGLFRLFDVKITRQPNQIRIEQN